MKRYLPLAAAMIAILLLSSLPAFAQSGLEGRIYNTINDLVRILNIIIIGFIAWAGFLIAKGDGSGIGRLIYGVIGILVVNAANLIITYFNY